MNQLAGEPTQLGQPSIKLFHIIRTELHCFTLLCIIVLEGLYESFSIVHAKHSKERKGAVTLPGPTRKYPFHSTLGKPLGLT